MDAMDQIRAAGSVTSILVYSIYRPYLDTIWIGFLEYCIYDCVYLILSREVDGSIWSTVLIDTPLQPYYS